MTLDQESFGEKGGFFGKVSVIGPVWFKTNRKVYSGFLVNISREGLTLQTRDVPNKDDEIVLSFQLPSSKYVFNLKAIVSWISSSIDHSLPRGLGARFVEMETADERHIEQYIGRYMVPKL